MYQKLNENSPEIYGIDDERIHHTKRRVFIKKAIGGISQVKWTFSRVDPETYLLNAGSLMPRSAPIYRWENLRTGYVDDEFFYCLLWAF